MAGKFQTKNVYVDTQYDNIIIVDPNLVESEDGSPIPRLVQHEDLVYYANLETKVVPRTKLASGESLDVINTTIASFIGGDSDNNLNFLKPKNKKGIFDTSWSDQITGDQSRVGGGSNQTTEQVSTTKGPNGEDKFIFNRNITNYQDTQTLGIKSINVKITSAGAPSVDITLVDIQGRTLFEQGENSLYSVFFNMPYPAFYLTLKGYYGKAIRLQLALISFNAKFDPKNGNFDISLKLIGRPSALLFDTILGYAKTAPKMFKREYFFKDQNSTSNQTGTSNTNVKKLTTTLGRQKLEEVYSEYESKKLIPEGFPRLSIEDFQYRIENFEETLKKMSKQTNMQILGEVYKYRKLLQELREEVHDYSISRYLDVNNIFKIKNEIYIPFKADVDRTKKDAYISRVKKLIDDLSAELKENPVFGENGSYEISPNSGKVSSSIPVNINQNTLLVTRSLENEPLEEIDYQNTYFIRTGKVYSQDNDEYLKFKANLAATTVTLTKEIDITTGSIIDVPTDFFVFGSTDVYELSLVTGGFLDVITNAEKNLASEEQKIELGLSQELAITLATSDKGIGFRPTIRNVFAVIMAGCDTFYRLMDETHRLAWEKRNDKIRLNAILQDGQGVDSVGYTAGNSQENIVYPWPQYYVREVDKDGKELYTIQYPGDPQYVNITKGNNIPVWPEVNFTEQYLTAASQKLDEQDNSIIENPVSYKPFSQINSIWGEDTFIPYSSAVNANLLFEILERSYVNANYGKFNRRGIKTYQIDKLIGDLEAENIKESISNDLILIEILKNYKFNYSRFKNYLQNNFLTKWFSYKNNIFTSEYIDEQIFFSKFSSLLHLDYFSSYTTKVTNELETNLKNYFKDTQSNDQVFLDTFPLTYVPWLKDNMANGNSISSTDTFNQTNQIYTIHPSIKKICRLNKNEDGKSINLFTNSKILNNGSIPSLTFDNGSQSLLVSTSQILKQYFENKNNNPNSLYVSESVIDYGNEYSGQVKTQVQTTSLFNTPYFINSIIDGVELEKTAGDTPYAALGYLYLNSLPLITTKEKLKSFENGTQSDLEYLAASFTKFSAFHQLPYAWVLKYGSIWHRYKKWIKTGKDILDDTTIWKNFDASNSWDPSGDTKTKSNVFSQNGTTQSSIKLQEQTISTNNPHDPLLPLDTRVFNVGYYPKVLNSVYRFFTKKDLFSGYTNDAYVNAITEKGLEVNLGGSFNIPPSFINGYKNTIVNSYGVTINVNPNDSNFTSDFTNKKLLIPSCGLIYVNQANFECFDDLNNEKIPLLNNESFYNGSVRSLWGSSNFGYFDHDKIKKPKPDQYIKKIKKTDTIQSSFDLLSKDSTEDYSSIEEIFAIFDKSTLDLFEDRFLYFIDPESKTTGNILPYENWQATSSSVAGSTSIKNKRLFYQIQNLFTVDSNTLNSDLVDKQLENFHTRVKEFLTYDILLNIENAGNFERQIFNEFSGSQDFMPPDIKYIYNPYNNTLPPIFNFNLSEINYPKEWEALKLNVGFSTIQNLKYNGASSFITDFFSIMDVEFNVDNIVRLSQLIKIYVTLRLKSGNLSKSGFQQLLTEYLKKQERFQAEMINETFEYLNKKLKSVERIDDQTQSTVTGNVLKLETYSTLKGFNDKWIAGSDLLSKTIFEDFLFLDKANSDIGDTFTIDPTSEQLRGILRNLDSISIMDVISTILGENQFIFMAMPSYINFYNIQKSARLGEEIPHDIPNSLFGTFMNVDYINSKPKFVCQYVGDPSKNLANDSPINKFNNDSFDIRRPSSNPLVKEQTKNINRENSNLVTAFNVDFGIQNQNIFSDIQLDMSEKKNTAESFKLISDLGNTVSGDKVGQQSTSLYSIYKNRSYTCQVTSMGNAMIQPTMYFNLRHVPLFYGPYWIMEINHQIDDKRFDTTFKGIRMPLYALPQPDSYLSSIKKNLLEKTKTEIIKETNQSWELSTGYTNDPNATVNTTPTLDDLGVCSDNVFVDYVNIPFVNSISTTISDSELIKKLKDNSTDNLTNAYLFGIANVSIGNRVDMDQIFSFNNNLFAYQTSSKYSGSVETYITQQACVRINNTPTPIISFLDYNSCIQMATALHGPQITTLLKPLVTLNNDLSMTKEEQIGKAMAQMYITLFETLDGYDPTGKTSETLIKGAIDTKLANKDILPTAFDAYSKIFANAASKLGATI